MSKPNNANIGSYLTSLFSNKPSEKKNKPKKTNSLAQVSSSSSGTVEQSHDMDAMEDSHYDFGSSSANTSSSPAKRSGAKPNTSRRVVMTSVEQLKTANAIVDWKDRTNPGKILVDFGDNSIDEVEKSDQVKVNKPAKRGQEKYMYDKLHKQSNVLLDRLEDIGSKILEYHNIETAKPLNYYSDQPEVYIGRILSESVGGDDKLNPSSILLEGLSNVDTSDCKITKLNFDKFGLDSNVAQTLFPGQVVAVKGLNTVQFLRVEKIYTGVPLPTEPKKKSEENKEKSKLKIMVAVGPFTLRHNILYNPLHDLVNLVEANEPNVLLLVGPFLSENNAVVSSGLLEETFEEIFQERVIEKLRSIETNCNIVLIPSLNDVHGDFVFPQPPLESVDFEKIQSFPNPCTFSVSSPSCGNVNIGVTSIDVLKDIKEKEYTFGYVEDKARHEFRTVMEQGYYYPRLLPSEEIPLDYSLVDGNKSSLKIEGAPHILILPSDASGEYCGVINNTLVINPTRLSGNENRKEGSYAIIEISNNESLALDKRVHVQIVNI